MRSVLGWVVLAPLIKRIEFIKSPKLLTLVTASESPTNLEGLIVWKKRAVSRSNSLSSLYFFYPSTRANFGNVVIFAQYGNSDYSGHTCGVIFGYALRFR